MAPYESSLDGDSVPGTEMRELRASGQMGSNVILVGASGAGKSTVAVHLARLLGYGLIDMDAVIEGRCKQSVEEIFEANGEAHFRGLESQLVGDLDGIRSHVVATGGGAVVDDDNWERLSQLGVTVWVNTPPEEIARRFLGDERELRRRPLLKDVLEQPDFESRHRLLSERIKALVGNRIGRYRQSRLVVSDHFCTPDSTAQLIRDTLVRAGFLTISPDTRPYDRWHIL